MFGSFFRSMSDDLLEIDDAFPHGNLGKEESVLVLFHRHILDVRENRVGREGAGGVHGIFAERQVVSEIEADADPFAAELLQPGSLFRGAIAFVVFEGQLHPVFAQDRFGQSHGFLDSARTSA